MANFGWGEALQSLGQSIQTYGQEMGVKNWEDIQKKQEHQRKMDMELIKGLSDQRKALIGTLKDKNILPQDKVKIYTEVKSIGSRIEDLMGVQTTIPAGPTAGTAMPSPTAGVQGPTITQGMPAGQEYAGPTFEAPPEEVKPPTVSEISKQGDYESIGKIIRAGFIPYRDPQTGNLFRSSMTVDTWRLKEEANLGRPVSMREAAMSGAVLPGEISSTHPWWDQFVMSMIDEAYPEIDPAMGRWLNQEWAEEVARKGGENKLGRKVTATGKYKNLAEYKRVWMKRRQKDYIGQ